jgi:hypothetical protein
MLILLVSVLIYAFFTNPELYHGKAHLPIVRVGAIRMNLEPPSPDRLFSMSSGTSCILVVQSNYAGHNSEMDEFSRIVREISKVSDRHEVLYDRRTSNSVSNIHIYCGPSIFYDSLTWKHSLQNWKSEGMQEGSG